MSSYQSIMYQNSGDIMSVEKENQNPKASSQTTFLFLQYTTLDFNVILEITRKAWLVREKKRM